VSAAFTPGPWKALRYQVEVDGKGTVAVVQNPWNDPTEKIANARLIAAAPELYGALSDLMENPLFQTAIGGNPNMVERLLDRANTALAKARGEQAK
jgi:hypothetical protein